MERNSPEWIAEVAARRDFVDHMLRHTVQLIRVEDGQPAGKGSGVLVALGERLFLLSVLHVFKRSDWFFETNTVDGDKPLLLQVPPVNWVTHVRLDEPTCGQRDGLAWAEFDVAALKEKLTSEPRLKGQAVALDCYAGPLDQLPVSSESYNFVATPPREFHRERNVLVREPLFELDMEYDGSDERGHYRFRLAGDHRGHDFYRGSSGAPIATSEGTIVALVQGGSEETNVIFGVPLWLYSRALEVSRLMPPKF